MATYKEVKGVTIQTVDGDPVENAGTWASTTSSNSPHEELGAGGTATDTIIFGGQQSPSASPRTRGETETWNGSAWTEVGDLNTVKKNQAGAGTSTSALSSSGQDPSNDNSPLVEQWNGSAWSEVAEVNTARRQLAGAGVSGTAALIFFGYGGSPETFTNVCESWNGSAWTEVGDTNTGRVRGGSFGTYTSAIGAGGSHDGSNNTANSESWNGTAWTETNNLNTARRDLSSHGAGGSNTDGLIFAGYSGTANLASNESWDGTSWTETADLSTGFRNGFGSQQGSSTSAIAGLGFSTTYATQVEEFSFPPPTAAILVEGDAFLIGGTGFKGAVKATSPATTWSSGGSLNTARRDIFGIGTGIPTSMIAGGSNPPRVANSEQYNGTSWTEVGDLTEGTTSPTNMTNGTPLSAMAAAGNTGPSQAGVQDSESWNGSSWSNSAELNISAGDRGGSGTGTAAFVFGGTNPSNPNGIADSELYDGTSWSEVNNLNTVKYSQSGVGTPTSSLCINGYDPGAYTTDVESWNGTSWTEIANTNNAQGYGGAAGQSNQNALKFGGSGGPTGFSAFTELWNGSSWTEIGDLSANYAGNAGSGSAASALNSGGGTNPTTFNAVSEEFEGSLTLQTITVS